MRVSLQNFKMINDDLDKEFQAAVESINNHEEPFPADTLLKLYAFYKKRLPTTTHVQKAVKPLLMHLKQMRFFR